MFIKKELFNNKIEYIKSCKKRNYEINFEVFENLYIKLNQLLKSYDELRFQQKQIKEKNQESENIKSNIIKINIEIEKCENELNNWMMHQPNILLDQVHSGLNENDNIVIFESDHCKKNINKTHDQLIQNLIMQEESSNVSGSRFVIFKEELSELKNVLVNFLIKNNKKNNFQEYSVPYLVNVKSFYGTGQYPKFKDEAFNTQNDKWLISTGEIPLVNMWKDYIFDQKDLPKLCTAFSPCFRKEAGSAGKDLKGLIRLHQFHKVELVSIATEESAEEIHQKQLKTACDVLDLLKLEYRILLHCGADTGFSASKQYDIEVWMPGMNKYLEIASCSQCGTFQAVRANIRYKNSDGKIKYCHTLNGSSLPIERLIAAIVENYYNEKTNQIEMPEVLKPYLSYDKIDLNK